MSLPQPWSRRFSGYFHCTLPPDVAAWLDQAEWADTGFNGFCERVEPEAILDPGSCAVWGGQMLPDTFPVLTDWGSNTLCLRFSPDGTVSEVVAWMEDGQWHPSGTTFAQALVYDAARSVAEDLDRFGVLGFDDSEEASAEFPLARWAARWIWPDIEAGAALYGLLSGFEGAPALSPIPVDLPEVAVRRDLCERCLRSGLADVSYDLRVFAEGMGVSRDSICLWLADTAFSPRLSAAK